MLATTSGKYAGRCPKYGTTSRTEGALTGGPSRARSRPHRGCGRPAVPGGGRTGGTSSTPLPGQHRGSARHHTSRYPPPCRVSTRSAPILRRGARTRPPRRAAPAVEVPRRVLEPRTRHEERTRAAAAAAAGHAAAVQAYRRPTGLSGATGPAPVTAPADPPINTITVTTVSMWSPQAGLAGAAAGEVGVVGAACGACWRGWRGTGPQRA
jgi:hypothetical protein